jgi:hypothetical protein
MMESSLHLFTLEKTFLPCTQYRVRVALSFVLEVVPHDGSGTSGLNTVQYPVLYPVPGTVPGYRAGRGRGPGTVPGYCCMLYVRKIQNAVRQKNPKSMPCFE